MRSNPAIAAPLCALLAACALTLHGCPALAPPAAHPAQLQCQQDMEALIAWLDSPAYGRQVWWGEHVVLCYRLAQKRDPTLAEFALMNMLREHPGLKRSEALGLAMASDAEAVTWEKCADFLAGNKADAFKSNPDVRLIARALAARPANEVAEALRDDEEAWPEPAEDSPGPKGTKVPGESYETYYGFLHAHSHFSLDADQSGTLPEAYAMARDQARLDFFGVTDHAEFLILWPWQRKWERTLAVAEAFNEPGRFVAFAGFEWSNPLLGHMSVLNTGDFTHTLRTFRVKAMYDWIAARPEAFAQYNHPGDYDFLGLEFAHFRPYPRAAAQMVGVETWNTNYGLDQYFYAGSWNSPLSFLDLANQRGWRIGALGAQDNHSRDWGLMNEFRTGVLARELTREAITEAFRARRFYATEDKDLALDFRCHGYPMGATAPDGPREFTLEASDASGDAFTLARLFRNGVEVARQELTGSELSIQLVDNAPLARPGDYYYVIVTQADDNDNNGRNDEALSSPIWIAE